MSGPGDERPADGRDPSPPAAPSPPGHPADQNPSGPSGPSPPGRPEPDVAPYGQQYGQPPSGGSAPGPSPYGQPSGHSPYAGPAGTAPAEPPYVYNPYGNFPYPSSYPTPAGLGSDAEPPPRRPGSLHLALVLVVVSALPYLFAGLVALGGAGQAASALPPESVAQLEQLGVTVAQFAQVVQAVGGLMLVVALLYVLLGVLAWTGRRWARALLAATTVGFALLVAAAVLAAGSQEPALAGGGALVLAVPLVLALAGVGLMFGGQARDWFARRR